MKINVFQVKYVLFEPNVPVEVCIGRNLFQEEGKSQG